MKQLIIILILFVNIQVQGQIFEKKYIGIGNIPYSPSGLVIHSAQIGDANANGLPDLFVVSNDTKYYWILDYKTESPQIELLQLPEFSAAIVIETNGDKISDLLVSNSTGEYYYEGCGFLKYEISKIAEERSFYPSSKFSVSYKSGLEVTAHSPHQLGAGGAKTPLYAYVDNTLKRIKRELADRSYLEDIDFDGKNNFIKIKKQVVSYFDQNDNLTTFDLPPSLPEFMELYLRDFDLDQDVDIFIKALDGFHIFQKTETGYEDIFLDRSDIIDNFIKTDINLDGQEELSIVGRSGVLYTIHSDFSISENQFSDSHNLFKGSISQQFYQGSFSDDFIRLSDNIITHKNYNSVEVREILPEYPLNYNGIFHDVDEDGKDEIFLNDKVYTKNGVRHYSEAKYEIFDDFFGVLLSVEKINNDDTFDYVFQKGNLLVCFLSTPTGYSRLESQTNGIVYHMDILDLDGDGDKDFLISQMLDDDFLYLSISIIENQENQSLSDNQIIEPADSQYKFKMQNALEGNLIKPVPYILTDVGYNGTYDLKFFKWRLNSTYFQHREVSHSNLLKSNYERRDNAINSSNTYINNYINLNDDPYIDRFELDTEQNYLKFTINKPEDNEVKLISLNDYHLNHRKISSITEANTLGERHILLNSSTGYVKYKLNAQLEISDFEKLSLDISNSLNYGMQLLDIDHDDDFDIISDALKNSNATIWFENKSENPYVILAPFYDHNGNNILDGQDFLLKNVNFETQSEITAIRNDLDGHTLLYFDPGTFSTTLNLDDKLWIPSDVSTMPLEIDIQGDTSFIGLVPNDIKNDIKSVFNIPALRCASQVTAYATLQNRGNKKFEGSYSISIDASLSIISTDVPYSTFEIDGDKKIYIWDDFELNPSTKEVIAFRLDIPGIEEFDFMFPKFTFLGTLKNEVESYENKYKGKLKCSYDPNDKLVNPVREYGSLIPNEEILYTIRFQNTGNDFAENIEIVDTLDKDLNFSSLNIISTSHPSSFSYSTSQNVVSFKFQGIYLPDSSMNQSASNGFISYTIDQKENLQIGEKIMNTAYIYFDSNPPIKTNTTQNLIFEEATNTIDLSSKLDFQIYPNPNHGILNIKSQSEIISVKIFDAQGRLILSSNRNIIELPSSLNGVYFVQAFSKENVSSIKRVIIHQNQ